MKTKINNKAEVYNSPLLDELLAEITPEEQEKTDRRMMLAARIADAIKAKGWKKIEFAQKMGKSPSEISKWLSGTHNFESDTLFEIGKVLGIEIIMLEEREPVYVVKEVYYTEVMQLEQPITSHFSSMRMLMSALQLTGDINAKDKTGIKSPINSLFDYV